MRYSNLHPIVAYALFRINIFSFPLLIAITQITSSIIHRGRLLYRLRSVSGCHAFQLLRRCHLDSPSRILSRHMSCSKEDEKLYAGKVVRIQEAGLRSKSSLFTPVLNSYNFMASQSRHLRAPLSGYCSSRMEAG
jgi:hypothetical protein